MCDVWHINLLSSMTPVENWAFLKYTETKLRLNLNLQHLELKKICGKTFDFDIDSVSLWAVSLHFTII